MQENFFIKTPGIGGKIKRRYSDFIVEEITANHECKVEFFLASEEEKQKLREKISWPAKPENEREINQLILEMEKFNLDLILALKIIARFIGVSQKRIGYAGIKDKRGITSQLISIWNPDYEKLKQFKSRSIFLKPLQWSNKRIELGELNANKFEITIREIDLEKKELEKRINECFNELQKGIPNYFGEQRFGGIRQVTHLVGKEFIKGNFEQAIKMYLTFSVPKEEEQVRNARKNLFESNDFSKALKEFPQKYRFERAILNHLTKYPKDFVGAFRALPKKLRYLFTHAFQSHLFNKIIKERIKQGISLNAIEGDILEEGIPTAPLIGFDSEFAEGVIGEIEKKVLQEEEIELNQFKINSMNEMSSKGSRKKIVLIPENLKLINIEEDEFNAGKLKAIISFTLSKGNYATTVLQEIMKN